MQWLLDDVQTRVPGSVVSKVSVGLLSVQPCSVCAELDTLKLLAAGLHSRVNNNNVLTTFCLFEVLPCRRQHDLQRCFLSAGRLMTPDIPGS